MAKNKRPRKRYVKRYTVSNWEIKPEEFEEFNSRVVNFSMKIEVSLRSGTCHYDDFFFMRDFFHWCVIALCTRDEYDEKERSEVMGIIDKAATASVEVQTRGLRNGCRFVCKADELELIQTAAEFVDDFYSNSFKANPTLVMKEWTVMQHYAKLAFEHKINISPSIGQLKRDIERCLIF